MSPIRSQLDSQWFSVHGPNAESFWAHEWEKHGTCSIVLPELRTQFKYFKTGLNLNNQYNIKQMLDKGSIVPGKTYSVQSILKALKKGLRVPSQVTCIRSTVSEKKINIPIFF